MKNQDKFTQSNPRPGKKAVIWIIIAACVVAACAVAAVIWLNANPGSPVGPNGTTPATGAPTAEPTQAPTEPPLVWSTGFVATTGLSADYCSADGATLGTLLRGTEVEYAETPGGKIALRVNGVEAFLQEGASIASDVNECVPEHTLYVRTALNLRDIDGKLLTAFANKGESVTVTGCDFLHEDGAAHMYRVKLGETEGYIMPWYLVEDENAALAHYDNGYYATHASRGNNLGAGDAASLDYYPREKGPIDGNVMPSETRALYIATWCVGNVDAYINIAKQCDINAFVVDIADGSAIGYGGDVMKQYAPSAAAAASNTVEAYQRAIKKLKDAGYYVIGRITTFNDTYFVKDHPECAITSPGGGALKIHGVYWPTAYDRLAWQYKVDLAVEAVELMGFNEIQFDYVRFPDLVSELEAQGRIDYHNANGESKAQAIQNFLMYATDILHEHGAYVSADVFGESAYTYVTSYGHYWAAISNVVDVISGMPYPDHFSGNEAYKPWEHPYETLHTWGGYVMQRQKETTTPAVVRTWIQCYNAIKAPYNTYGPEEVKAQIRGLLDSGCTGGYMTWNHAADPNKFRSLISAFKVSE